MDDCVSPTAKKSPVTPRHVLKEINRQQSPTKNLTVAKSPRNTSGEQQQPHIESTDKQLPNTINLDSTFNENQPDPLKSVLPDIVNNVQLNVINSSDLNSDSLCEAFGSLAVAGNSNLEKSGEFLTVQTNDPNNSQSSDDEAFVECRSDLSSPKIDQIKVNQLNETIDITSVSPIPSYRPLNAQNVIENPRKNMIAIESIGVSDIDGGIDDGEINEKDLTILSADGVSEKTLFLYDTMREIVKVKFGNSEALSVDSLENEANSVFDPEKEANSVFNLENEAKSVFDSENGNITIEGNETICVASLNNTFATIPNIENCTEIIGINNSTNVPDMEKCTAVPGTEKVAEIPVNKNYSETANRVTVPGTDNVATIPKAENVAEIPVNKSCIETIGPENVTKIPDTKNFAETSVNENCGETIATDNCVTVPDIVNVSTIKEDEICTKNAGNKTNSFANPINETLFIPHAVNETIGHTSANNETVCIPSSVNETICVTSVCKETESVSSSINETICVTSASNQTATVPSLINETICVTFMGNETVTTVPSSINETVCVAPASNETNSLPSSINETISIASVGNDTVCLSNNQNRDCSTPVSERNTNRLSLNLDQTINVTTQTSALNETQILEADANTTKTHKSTMNQTFDNIPNTKLDIIPAVRENQRKSLISLADQSSSFASTDLSESPINRFVPTRSSSIFDKDEEFDNAIVPDESMTESEIEGRLSIRNDLFPSRLSIAETAPSSGLPMEINSNAFDTKSSNNLSPTFKKPNKPSLSKLPNQQFDCQHEEFNASGMIFQSADFDFLLSKGSKPNLHSLCRDSLLLRFDPLVGAPVPIGSVINPLSLLSVTEEQELVSVTGSSSTKDSGERLIPLDNDQPIIETLNRTQHSWTAPVIDRASELLAEATPTSLSFVNQSGNATMSVGLIENMKSDNDCQQFVSASIKSDNNLESQMPEEIERKIKHENIKTEDIEKKLKEAETKEQALLKRITDKDKTILKMSNVLEEYEKTIAELVAEKEDHEKTTTDIIAERDMNSHHLASLEVTFSDLHAKYERSKQITLQLKDTQDKLVEDIKTITEQLRLQELRYDKMKNHAMQQLEIANTKLETIVKTHAAEIARLKASLKKEEVSKQSISEQLNQKTKENSELVKICDELINGQSSS